jgi:Uma2 family endonuclease
MATIKVPRRQRLVLLSEPWESYVRLGRVFRDRPALRITYDRGVLEIITTTHEHEHIAILLARLVFAWTEERRVPLKSGGSMTFRRRDRKRGLEPDGCFWIANEPAVRSLTRIDLRRDPPPDLVLEVDVTRSSLPRLPIYAALGFPEVWRLDGPVLAFNLLQADGAYAPSATSRALAPLASADVARFLALGGQVDDTSVVAQFRAWLQKLPTSPPTP